MNHEKFIYFKTQRIDQVSINYCWYLIDKVTREGVHFHGQKYFDIGSMSGFLNEFAFMANGIECHKKQPHYDGHTPVKGYCLVTLGDCYCDGSSLQASEQLGYINPDGVHDDHVWSVLHQYYGYWIEDKKSETA